MNGWRPVTKRFIVFCALLALMALAQAAVPGHGLRAFLDRDHVALGDTVTLNIEGAGALNGTPDLSPLQSDFDVLGTSSSSSVQLVNGAASSSTQLGIALRPKRAGTLTVPSLIVGGSPTPSLILHVASAPSGAQGTPGDPAFLEASVDATSPYVGQQIVYTLRLYYASGLTGGQLDDPQADDARMIHLDSDTRFSTQRGGQTYQVIERHYALIPQHAGNIVVRGPGFQGQMLDTNNANGIFDSFFGDGKPLEARADDIVLDARAIPAGAGMPWLPVQSVQLKLDGLPADGNARVGEPLTLTLRIDAVGVTAQRLPEPQLPPIDGARVYPDRSQDTTRQDGGWLHGTRIRGFAIVPGRNGALIIPTITLNWWDVAHDHAAQARILQQVLQVTGAAAGNATPPIAPTISSANASSGGVVAHAASRRGASLWRIVALASLAPWAIVLTALAWWWLRRQKRAHADSLDSIAGPRAGKRELRQRALHAARRHDATTCEHALLDWARETKPGLHNLGQLRDALAEPAQREALDALERARWQGGDAAAACEGIARVFERGIIWHEARAQTAHADDGLPPLYP
ncbi:MAG: BatD family protein [Rhodanobacteraceae bacterium]